MKYLNFVITLITVLLVSPTNADISLSRVDESNRQTNPNLIIKGEIRKGDYVRTLNAVKDAYIQGDLGQLFVTLDSSGGDVMEAMKIGQLVRELKLSTSAVFGRCDSACVFILVAGAERRASSGVGIHRPFFKKEYFSGLPADAAKQKYEEMRSQTRAYLISMDVPTDLIERMFRIPSNEVERLSFDEVQKWISGSPSSLDEWLIAKCGSYTKDESNDYSMWRASRIELSPGYSNYLEEKITEVEGCRIGILAKERRDVADELFPKVKSLQMPNTQLNNDAAR